MMETARPHQAGTAATSMASPRPAPAQRPSTVAPTPSISIPTSFHADCINSACVDAFLRIEDARFVQDTFAGINARYATNYGIAEPIQAALNSAYQVLLDCEYRMIMARVGSVATMLRQVKGQPTLTKQGVLVHLLRLTGMQISMPPRAIPLPVPATMGTSQRQSVHVGGGPTPAAGHMHAARPAAPAAVRTPVPVHTTAAAHTPAPGHTPASVYVPAAAYGALAAA